MKQIIAIIRDEQVEATKEALGTIGVRGVTFLYVSGRGLQKGRISTRELGEILNRNLRMQLTGTRQGNDAPEIQPPFSTDTELAFGFLPKRMLIIVAYDEEVNRIVQAIVNVNQTGRNGDGRIFICPMISAIRVRTGEQGDKALS
jgi:nitrogen regulatory protein PII 2